MKRTIYGKVTNLLSLVGLVALLIYSLVTFNRGAAQMPSHYNIRGEITEYGDGKTVFVLLILLAMIWLMSSVIEILPKMMATSGMDLSNSMVGPIFSCLTDMTSTFKLVLVANLGYMIVCTLLVRELGRWFMPVFLILLFLPIVVTMIRLARVTKKG